MIDTDISDWIAQDESCDIAAQMRTETPIREWQRGIGAGKHVQWAWIDRIDAFPGNSKALHKDTMLSMRLTRAAYILNEIVEVNSEKAGGVPVLSGTRFKVAQVLGELADGKSVKKIAREFDLDLIKIVSLLRGLSIQLDRPFRK